MQKHIKQRSCHEQTIKTSQCEMGKDRAQRATAAYFGVSGNTALRGWNCPRVLVGGTTGGKERRVRYNDEHALDAWHKENLMVSGGKEVMA